MDNSNVDKLGPSSSGMNSLPSSEEIRLQLGAIVESFIALNRPVYLETFGIIFPVEKEITKRYELKDKLVIRRDLVRSVAFEKCSDLTAYHRERFSEMVETQEIAERVLSLMDTDTDGMSGKDVFLQNREIRKRVRAVAREIRDEVIKYGRSRSLNAVGEIFSTHNRQGATPKDWFAGADIFIKPSFQKTVLMGREYLYDKPLLRDSWEPLEALYGSPIRTWNLDLKRALSGLGLSSEGEFPKAKVAAYLKKGDGRGGPSNLIFCSNGLSVPGIERSGYGTEVIFQIEWAQIERAGSGEIPSWPLAAFTLSWLLSSSGDSKRLKIGSGLGIGEPLSGDRNSLVTHIFTSPSSLLPGTHAVDHGMFDYVSVVGITEDEAKWAQHFSSSYLLTILGAKGQDQITRPFRSSMVRNTLLQSERSQHQVTEDSVPASIAS